MTLSRLHLPRIVFILMLASLTLASSAETSVDASAAGAPTLASPPVISGTAQQGQTLTSGTGTWSGTQPFTYSYQWWRCNSSGGSCAYLGVTGPTYTLVAADVGSTMRTLVTASNSAGSGQASSVPTAVVVSSQAQTVVAPSFASAPVISGTAQQGQTLTSGTGTWSGTQPFTYSYQWWRCNSSGGSCAYLGVTGPTYTLVAADVGSTMRTLVTASNSAGSGQASSVPTAVVVSSQAQTVVAPSFASAPVISGTAQQGQTLTSGTGTWSGTQPFTYSYQWWRCNSSGGSCAYLGVTGPTYTLLAADVGSTMRTLVTASNSAGSAQASSVPTAVVSGTGQQTPAPQCSRSSLGSCPASYFTGPLGNNNLIPLKPGAFLINDYGGQGTTWAQNQAGVLQRQQDIGRKFDGIGFHYGGSQPWGGVYGMADPTSYTPRVEQWIHDNGSFPVITWTPEYTITQINNGAADAIWAKAANYFKTYNFTIMLRAFTEFDGPFNAYSAVPWSGNGNVNSCGAPFIAAWKRMVNIFKANGATNVGFWWVPEEGVTRSCINVSYPGDAYVDWVGSDWYNVCMVGRTDQWCTPMHSGWAQFGELFNYPAGSNYQSQHSAWGPRKPFVVGEAGTWYDPNYPTYKGDWFRNVPAAAKNMLYLRGIQFYDKDVSAVEGALNNFRVDYPTSNPSVYSGYKALAADPWFNTGGA